MTRSARAAEPPAPRPRRRIVDLLIPLVVVAAVAKIAVALVLVAAHAPFLSARAIPSVILVAHVGVFGGAAAFLAAAGRHDRRAVYLGMFFLLVAVSFSNGLVARLEGLPGGADQVYRALLSLHPDAFLPLFLWLFVQHFPRLHRIERGRRVESAVIAASFAAGVLLFTASAARDAVLSPLAWDIRGSWFDAILFGLAIPALPFGLWKARRADARERRRYSVFVSGLALGFLPIAAQVLVEATSPASAQKRAQERRALPRQQRNNLATMKA